MIEAEQTFYISPIGNPIAQPIVNYKKDFLDLLLDKLILNILREEQRKQEKHQERMLSLQLILAQQMYYLFTNLMRRIRYTLHLCEKQIRIRSCCINQFLSFNRLCSLNFTQFFLILKYQHTFQKLSRLFQDLARS